MLRSLPGDEAVSLFAQLLTGGLEPVIGCLASALATLLQPQQTLLDEVAEGRRDVRGLVEEALRIDAPFHFVPRTTTQELAIGATTVPAGQRVVLVVAAANRDPAVFVEPASFDPDRAGPGHLSFGAGAPYCLGAALARLTIAESLEAVARWPGRRRGALDRERADLFGISAFERVLLA